MELQVKNRDIFGKKVKTLRRQNLVPAELYGHGIENRHLSVSKKEFSKIYKTAGEHTVINLVTEEKTKIPVFITDVQYDHLTNEFLAADFHQIKMDEKIQIKIPVEFINEAPAVKSGLILVKVLNEIEVEALPDKIPHNFQVDLSSLENAGQGIRVEDLKIPADVKILNPMESVIITVSEQAKEEIETPATPATETESSQETTPETQNSEKI